MNKRASILLVAVLTVLSLIAVLPKPALASITKPSVPEFSVQIVAYPYDVPTTHSIDPYTGQDITHERYHVENESIEVRIKNQPFTPYEIQENENNWTINFFYNIRIKGHFSEDWIELYGASDGYPHQWSDSDYTVLSYLLGGDADTVLGTKMIKLPAGGQVDFQVEAMIGYVHREISIPVPGTGWVFTGETSGWSETRTITIPTSTTSPTDSPTPNQTPTPTPDQELQQEPFPIALLITASGASLAIVSISLLVYFKKRHAKSIKREI